MAKKALDLSVFDRQLKTSVVTSVCRLKVELTPEQIEMVDAAFESGLYPKAAIERALREEWSVVISEKPLTRHREKQCSCYAK